MSIFFFKVGSSATWDRTGVECQGEISSFLDLLGRIDMKKILLHSKYPKILQSDMWTHLLNPIENFLDHIFWTIGLTCSILFPMHPDSLLTELEVLLVFSLFFLSLNLWILFSVISLWFYLVMKYLHYLKLTIFYEAW